MKIVYRKPDDAEVFDLDRYYDSLKKYGDVPKQEIIDNLEALKNQFSDTLHVSVLVNLGARLIVDEDGAKRYYDEHINGDWRGFERLRRISGYLVGSLERWNDGKKAEEKARVKHSVGQYTVNEKVEREEAKKVLIMENQNEYHK